MEFILVWDGALFAVAIAYAALLGSPPRNVQVKLYGPQVPGPKATLRTSYKELL